MTAPVFSGLYAQRHMHEYGTTREQMAEVAVKNHENGTKCEYSHFDFTLTVDDVLNAPHVTYSFGLYDCSPQTDGAACLIVASEKLTTRYTDHTRCGWPASATAVSPTRWRSATTTSRQRRRSTRPPMPTSRRASAPGRRRR